MPDSTTPEVPMPSAKEGRSKIDALRSSVRPVVTYAFVAALVGAFGYLVWEFATPEITAKVVDAVLILAASTIGWWYASRQKPT